MFSGVKYSVQIRRMINREYKYEAAEVAISLKIWIETENYRRNNMNT